MRRDPGKRIGGNTQVGTRPGQRLIGVPGRVNFIMALGPREVIVGGAGHDELGALGDAARIYGGAGPDLIRGGPGNDRHDGGPGNDLIYSVRGDDVITGGPGDDVIHGNKRGKTTVFPGSGTNRIIAANGHGGDRVMCAADSVNRITADRGDRIAPSCRGKRSRVSYVRLPSGRRSARAAQTDSSPLTAECSPPEPSSTDCEIELWESSLSGLWTHQQVPALQCPASHPWITDTDYAPFGTIVPLGVDVTGLGPIGIYIPLILDSADYSAGTKTEQAVATNWTLTGTNTYAVNLHCTDNDSERWGGP